MNRFNWTYLSDNGKKHHVGLMHGAQSGHLLVYCNTDILLIDFEVLEDKSYSFFIDEQLCEIFVEKKGEAFYYGFEINRKADTPLNNQRKRIEKRQLIQTIFLLFGFILLISGFVYGLKSWNAMKEKAALGDQLELRGLETSAEVLVVPHHEGDLLSYFFVVEGKAFTVEKAVGANEPIIPPTGMPLETGDMFVVRYIPYNPKLHIIDYERPTIKQIARYQDRAVKKYLQFNPDRDSVYAACLAKVAFELNGVQGFADIYHQNIGPEENPVHNNLSYKRLVRDEPFREKVQKNCNLLY